MLYVIADQIHDVKAIYKYVCIYLDFLYGLDSYEFSIQF